MFQKSLPKTSLIITTYNQPNLLNLALETTLRQKVAPHEIIVADDGSNEETEQVVREAATRSPVIIKHVWQQDIGFRLNRSRNNAIAVAESEYLSLVDGDCFLDAWFVHDHKRFSRQGRYVTGPRVDLNKKLRAKILRSQNDKISIFDIGVSKKIHFMRSLALANLMSGYRLNKSKRMLNPLDWTVCALGANLAFFRADAVSINGFNELWTYYGADDQEFATRLERNGVKRFKLLHYAINYHFKHDHLGVISEDKKLTPTSLEYLASLDETRTRCVDTLGLTRALSQKRPPIVVDGLYQKYVF